MRQSLSVIKKPIENELKLFEKHFRESMKSNVALLDKITYYIIKSKGKQIRPIFVFLSAKCVSEPNENTYTAASLIELLHTATLVHDDVVDDSYERRGFFSLNALWKNKIAVLVGDYLLSKGLLLALDNKQHKLLHILSTAVKDMSEGELLQLEKARKLNIDETVYFDIIKKKTASLIAAACSAGAASVSQSEELIEKFRDFGEKVGISYQIKDDLFDYGNTDIGKPTGIDIKEKKMTLPLIYALNKAKRAQQKRIIYLIKNDSANPKSIEEVIAFVREQGGIEYALQMMEKYRDEAADVLFTLPEGEARDSLKQLLYYTTSRDK
jgi:octaprenyl-diphosphate synthase